MFDHIYLTGFKIFGDHKANPTELIAQHFQQHPDPQITASVVEVTTKDTDAYIEHIKGKIAELRKEKSGAKVLNLHFGVGPNKIYHLERFAYNNKDFRIADNSGYQPRQEKISNNYGLQHPIHTKLDIHQLCSLLQKQFPCQLSLDPGRYLCNYIYFKSAHQLSTFDENSYSLFVHFPVLELVAHENNVKFVQKMAQMFLKRTQTQQQLKKEEQLTKQ